MEITQSKYYFLDKYQIYQKLMDEWNELSEQKKKSYYKKVYVIMANQNQIAFAHKGVSISFSQLIFIFLNLSVNGALYFE